MSRLQLNPIASPVSTYATPEVRQKVDGAEIIQLAEALKDIRPEVQQIVNNRLKEHIEASRRMAVEDAAKLAVSNQQQFKQAVVDGRIREQDNLWYKAQLRQEMAKHDASEVIAGMFEAYQQEPAMHDKSVDDVASWLDTMGSKLFEGRDGWEIEALAEVYNQGKQRVL